MRRRYLALAAAAAFAATPAQAQERPSITLASDGSLSGGFWLTDHLPGYGGLHPDPAVLQDFEQLNVYSVPGIAKGVSVPNYDLHVAGATTGEYLARCQRDGVHIRYNIIDTQPAPKGFEAAGEVSRVQYFYSVAKPGKIAVVLLGSQDIANGASAFQVEHNLHQIYTYMRAHGSRVLAVTPLRERAPDPRTTTFTSTPLTMAQERVRQQVRSWILSRHLATVDTDRAVPASLKDGPLAPGSGYAVQRRLAETVARAIRQMRP